MSLLDLNHVEILRGPQGTLYGAGAMGGLLKYVTNEPDPSQFSGQVGTGVSGTAHGGCERDGQRGVEYPAEDRRCRTARLRVRAARWRVCRRSGPKADTYIDRGDTYGARASLLPTPTRDLTVRLTALSQNINRNDPNYVEYGADGKPVWGT